MLVQAKRLNLTKHISGDECQYWHYTVKGITRCIPILAQCMPKQNKYVSTSKKMKSYKTSLE